MDPPECASMRATNGPLETSGTPAHQRATSCGNNYDQANVSAHGLQAGQCQGTRHTHARTHTHTHTPTFHRLEGCVASCTTTGHTHTQAVRQHRGGGRTCVAQRNMQHEHTWTGDDEGVGTVAARACCTGLRRMHTTAYGACAEAKLGQRQHFGSAASPASGMAFPTLQLPGASPGC
jgi:hypothetical protein